MQPFIGCFLLLFILSLVEGNQYHRTDINKDWKMAVLGGSPQAEALKGKIFNTSIPTTVHLDLEKTGDIPNPLIDQNYPKVKWVSDCNFSYSSNVTITDEIFNHDFQKLSFEGIDTYSEVFLNDKKILITENAFRKYSVYVSGLLRKGVNTIQVKISSAKGRDTLGQKKDPMPFDYAQTRKACYEYSWDWAPYLNSMGLWKPVYLESYTKIKVDYVWVRTRSITKAKATVNFAIALEMPDPEGKGLLQDYEFAILQDGESVATFSPSEEYTYHDVIVSNPKLWWPNGIGEPNIYDYRVQLFKKQPRLLVDERLIPFGIRTVQLNLENKKFQVKVNGYPIYCKGANYVPPDMFYPRLQNNRYKPANSIETLLDDAVASNFNMIRIWGGGQYESDKFLELASRKGIMLFYDFMFSDSVYPATEEFLLNVEEEIKQQIRRARNYPALTLWCGNNEVLQGINDWGWSSPKYRENYHKLFEVLIPKIIQYESSYIPYVPSSPIYGVGNYGLERGGDVHFWAVWAGGSPFQSYQSNVGKFNSQFGTQALPVWETIMEGMTKNPSYQSPALQLHERHGSRFNTLVNYMNMYMRKSINFEMETYQSGLLQAYAIELAIKSQRATKPYSMGTLFWQLNDAWPSISWSSIDYYGRWKPLQFMAKRTYPDVSIFVVKESVFAVNDKLYSVSILAIIKIFDLNGTLVNKIETEVILADNEVKMLHLMSTEDYKGTKKEECVVYTEIVAGKDQTMVSTHFNAFFKDLKLYPVEIEVTYHPDFNVLVLETKTTVVKNLYISRKSKYLKASNNYFDLVPGHPVKVTILGDDKLESIKDDLVFRSYRDVYLKDSKVTVRSQ